MLFKNKFCTKLLLISAFFSIASFSYADGGLLFLEKNLKASKRGGSGNLNNTYK